MVGGARGKIGVPGSIQINFLEELGGNRGFEGVCVDNRTFLVSGQASRNSSPDNRGITVHSTPSYSGFCYHVLKLSRQH